jgi:hypothetical protein
MLHISTIDVETPSNESDINPSPSTHHSDISTNQNNLFQWKDILPLSLFTIFCLIIATLISTYEDFDVTHTRPNPSTLRVLSKGEHHFNFIGAATKGMGWGSADRGAVDTGDSDFFEEWYGNSATSLQWKPSYNEIMLQHRSERIPRWTREQTSSQSSSLSTTANTDDATIPTKEDLQQAVLQLYKSLDELDDLKLMAEDYRWDDMKERMQPSTHKDGSGVYSALEYSMDVLKAAPSYYSSSSSQHEENNPGIQRDTTKDATSIKELPSLIGFDWGSCAWRHCGAKADAQEALAELYSSLGMLEPFECRFVIGKLRVIDERVFVRCLLFLH